MKPAANHYLSRAPDSLAVRPLLSSRRLGYEGSGSCLEHNFLPDDAHNLASKGPVFKITAFNVALLQEIRKVYCHLKK